MGNSLAVQWLGPLQGIWVQSLVRELRCRMPCSMAEKKKKKKKLLMLLAQELERKKTSFSQVFEQFLGYLRFHLKLKSFTSP